MLSIRILSLASIYFRYDLRESDGQPCVANVRSFWLVRGVGPVPGW
jgi:hypothetical protein